MYPNGGGGDSGTSSEPLQFNLLTKTQFCKIHFNTTCPSMKTTDLTKYSTWLRLFNYSSSSYRHQIPE